MPKKPDRSKRISEPRVAYKTARRQITASARSVRAMPSDPEWNRAEWEWVSANRRRLEKEYAGRWVAVADKSVVGSGRRLATALKQAKALGISHPFVTAFRSAKRRDVREVAHWL